MENDLLPEDSDIQRNLANFAAALRRPVGNGLAAAILMAAISLLIPNTFRCEVQILPADSKGGGAMSGMAAAASVAGVSLPGQDNADGIYVDIIKSRPLRKKLLASEYSFTTTKLFFFKTYHHETLSAYLRLKNADKAVQRVGNMIKVSRDIKTKLITASVESPSPELSLQMAQGLINSLEEFLANKAKTKGGIKAAFTQERLKEARQDYMASVMASESFLKEHRNYSSSNDPSVHLTSLRLENDLRLRQQVLTTLTLNYEQALLEEKNDMPILNVLDPGDLPIDHSSPARSLLTMIAFAGGIFGTYAWRFKRSFITQLKNSLAGHQA